MVHGILIPASDSRPLALQPFDRLEDYQLAVNGWIEAVDIPDIVATLYVNEEGLLRQLPYNRRATFLWWFHAPAARGHTRLVGDAVLVGLPDSDGASTNIPTGIARRLLERTPFTVSIREPSDARWHPSPVDHEDYLEAIIWATLLMEHAPGLQVRVDGTPTGEASE